MCTKFVAVLTAFLKSGIPLNKLECFRELHEENSTTCLAGRRAFIDLIPFVCGEK